MHLIKAITGTLALAACAALVPSASAQTLKVLTAGSSAQFGPFAVGAYALARSGGAQAFHYTVKTGQCGTSTCAALADSRSIVVNGTLHTIAPEAGNLWVVWSSNGIWAYLSVDSTVGVRNLFAVPRATLALTSLASLPVSATTNYPYWPDGTNDSALTTTVYNALNNAKLGAANTDIRPEDALFATNRALNTLGYGQVPDPRSGHSGQFLIGNGIKSQFGTGVATPVSFAIAGNDPFTNQAVNTTLTTIPIGAAPIVFLANAASGSDTASATGITQPHAGYLFSGSNSNPATAACAGKLVTGVSATAALTPILREPLSGTMNTTQYSVFWPQSYDQEKGVGNPPSNPLNLPCGAGFRYRAVGTGDEVKDVQTVKNAIGYSFFSYESTGTNAAYKYLAYAPAGSSTYYDPISSSYTNGALPTCPIVNGSYSCPVPSGQLSFPNLRNGKYTAWSIYRIITDSGHLANVKTLVAKAQSLVDSNIPDFVPFTPVCATSPSGSNDPGLALYREHFVPSTIESVPDSISITPNDGSLGSTVTCTVKRATLPALTLGGGTEAGGDVGGTIEGPFTSSPTYPGPTQTANH